MTTKQMVIDALKRLAGSMKAWTMLLGLITAVAAHYGFNVDPTTFWVIVGGFATLLGAQGATDWGSKAAKIHTASFATSQLMAIAKPNVRCLVNGGDKAQLILDNGDEYVLSDSLLEGAGYVRKQRQLQIPPVPTQGA